MVTRGSGQAGGTGGGQVAFWRRRISCGLRQGMTALGGWIGGKASGGVEVREGRIVIRLHC